MEKYKSLFKEYSYNMVPGYQDDIEYQDVIEPSDMDMSYRSYASNCTSKDDMGAEEDMTMPSYMTYGDDMGDNNDNMEDETGEEKSYRSYRSYYSNMK